MRWPSAAIILFASAALALAEKPSSSSTDARLDLEGSFLQRAPRPAETVKPRIGRFTWTLLAADGGARAFDAWSTRRMLRNNCSSGVAMPGTSTCNYEQNLPGFIANHPSGLYAFEATAWASEFAATRFLIHHHHPRIARLIPLFDALSTTSFAVNNLTLSIGGGNFPVSPSNAIGSRKR